MSVTLICGKFEEVLQIICGQLIKRRNKQKDKKYLHYMNYDTNTPVIWEKRTVRFRLYFTVMFCIVSFCCTVVLMYCAVLHCTGLDCFTLECIVLHITVLRNTVLQLNCYTVTNILYIQDELYCKSPVNQEWIKNIIHIIRYTALIRARTLKCNNLKSVRW